MLACHAFIWTGIDCGFPFAEHLDIIYINEKLNRDEWHTFEIGKTRFNDEALRQAGKSPIPFLDPPDTF